LSRFARAVVAAAAAIAVGGWRPTRAQAQVSEACSGPAVVIHPDAGPQRKAFAAWLTAHPGSLGDLAGLDVDRVGDGSLGVLVADADNDGTDELVIPTWQGSGSYLLLFVFRRAGEGFALVADAPPNPGHSDMWYSRDYRDDISRESQLLVRFCGKVYWNFAGGQPGRAYRDTYVWERGHTRPVCDTPWLREQRRLFQTYFDQRLYDAAHDFLDGVQGACRSEADPEQWLWMQSDLALTAYRRHTYDDCRDHVLAAKAASGFPTAPAALRKAMETNGALCQEAKGKEARGDFPEAHGDFSWLLALDGQTEDRIVGDPRFTDVLSAVVPDAPLAADEPERLRDIVKSNLIGPPDEIRVIDKRYVTFSACRAHDCESKAYVWFDTLQKTGIAALNGYLLSRRIDSKDVPLAFWKAYREYPYGGSLSEVRYREPGGAEVTIPVPAP
jgi:hypothetical protein